MPEFPFAEDVFGFSDEERQLVVDYVANLETGVTRDHCLCQWQQVDAKRWLKKSTNMDCPVHTREGLLLGFLKHTNKIAGDFMAVHLCSDCPADCKECTHDQATCECYTHGIDDDSLVNGLITGWIDSAHGPRVTFAYADNCVHRVLLLDPCAQCVEYSVDNPPPAREVIIRP